VFQGHYTKLYYITVSLPEKRRQTVLSSVFGGTQAVAGFSWPKLEGNSRQQLETHDHQWWLDVSVVRRVSTSKQTGDDDVLVHQCYAFTFLPFLITFKLKPFWERRLAVTIAEAKWVAAENCQWVQFSRPNPTKSNNSLTQSNPIHAVYILTPHPIQPNSTRPVTNHQFQDRKRNVFNESHN